MAAAPDVVTVADCGRVDFDAPLWATSAATDAAARPPVGGVGAGDGRLESIGRSKRSACLRKHVPPGRRRAHRRGSVSVAGGRRRARRPNCSACSPRTPPVLRSSPAAGPSASGLARSPLAKAAAALGCRVVEAIYGRDHRPDQLWSAEAGMTLAPTSSTDRPDIRRAAGRSAASARARDRRHGRQAGRPQGPGVAPCRHRGYRPTPRRSPRSPRSTASSPASTRRGSVAGCRRCRITPIRRRSTP